MTGATRQLPVVDAETGFFWTGGETGDLLIQHCSGCGHRQHPPLPRCPACAGAAVEPRPVSGRGRVASFTVNRQQWRKGLDVPFVYAAIELDEQAGLIVFSNVLGPSEAVRSGMRVEVTFERHDDVWLPLFAPVEEQQ